MTIDERNERLEFLNAAYVEQRRKDWEEYLIRERDLRSHIDAIWLRMERRDEELARRSQELDRRWQETREMFRESKHEADERGRALDERVDKLVSAIGELCRRLDEKKQ